MPDGSSTMPSPQCLAAQCRLPATEYGLLCLDHWPRLPEAIRVFVATTPPVDLYPDSIRSRYEAVQAVIVGLDGLG